MCDCYEKQCLCGTYYVSIHISDFRYSRNIILATLCPYCPIPPPRGTLTNLATKYHPNIFSVKNWLMESSRPLVEIDDDGSLYDGDWKGIRSEYTYSRKHQKAMGLFAIIFKPKVSAKLMDYQHVTFNGRANGGLVPDCNRYMCHNLAMVEGYYDVEDEKFRKELGLGLPTIPRCTVQSSEYIHSGGVQIHSCPYVSPNPEAMLGRIQEIKNALEVQ